MARQKQPPKATLRLNEQELTEIMVDLIEKQNGGYCTPDRARRIQRILDEKIDPAMRKIRVEYVIDGTVKPARK